MKRFTKMLALGLAAALVFGMSVQAAPSPDTTTSNSASVDEKSLPEGVTFAAVTENQVSQAKAAVEKEVGKKGTVVAAFEMTATKEAGDAKKEVTVKVPNVSRGDEVWLYKYEDAAFTKLVAKFKVSPEAGSITFVPMEGCYYAVVNMGKAAAPSGSSTPAATTGTGTSPKTGETVPVAGVMALVLLAGAAFCAKKVRYNR